jgi:hypothetical protein
MSYLKTLDEKINSAALESKEEWQIHVYTPTGNSILVFNTEQDADDVMNSITEEDLVENKFFKTHIIRFTAR